MFKEGGSAQGAWELGMRDKLSPGRGESHGFWGLGVVPRAGSVVAGRWGFLKALSPLTSQHTHSVPGMPSNL